MSGTYEPVLRRNAALTFGRGTTAVEVIPGTDQIANQVIALDDGQTQETREASNVRH